MSRCFPFPPPGYEKKHKPEEDLFQEEKRREKRHKKEKKSKRKREDDDTEERTKGRDKQKEKKDKHRDKKEEKSKSKGKGKSSTSEDATTAVEPEINGRDNANTREECSSFRSRGFSENKGASTFQGQNGWSVTDNSIVRESEELKFVQESGLKIKDEGKAIGSRTIQRSSSSDQRGYQESEESKFVRELGRRIKDEGKAIESRTIQTSSSDQRGYQEMHTSAVNCLHNSAKDMECERDQGVVPQKMEGKGHKKVESKGLKVGLQFNGNNTVQNLTRSVDRKIVTPPVQRDIQKTVQEKDKSKEKSDNKQGEKRKDRDKKEKKSHGKDKGRDKIKKKEKDEEKKKEETEKERPEYKKRDQDRSKELFKNGLSSSSKNSNVSSQVDNKIVSTEANVKKMKDVEANGFGHENEIQSKKEQRHQLMNNGKILEACQSFGLLDSNRLSIPLQDTGRTKYHEMNGTVGPQLPYMPNQKPPSEPSRSDQPIEALKKPPLAHKVVEASRKLPQAPVVVEASTENALSGKVIETSRIAPQASRIVEPLKKPPRAERTIEPSRKPPHPDLKYLNEILSVPKMEEWSEVDDQEWLFSNKNLPLEKQKPDGSVDSRQPHVWSETLHIESADLYALPYVIPY